MKQIVTALFENVQKNLVENAANGKSLADIVVLLQTDLKELGREMIKGIIEQFDELVLQDKTRIKNWEIVRRNQLKTIDTTIGDIEFNRTYFKHKNTGEYAFLTDLHFGITPHQRLSEDKQVEILEKSIDLSYAKSAPDLSRQTTKNLVHNLDKTILKQHKNKEKKKIK